MAQEQGDDADDWSGLGNERNMDDDTGPLRGRKDAAVLVRAGLTNALRHAPGADVRVVVGVAPTGRTLTVHVENDATIAQESPVVGTGRGLAGLRDRVHEIGGRFRAGPAASGRWGVEAHLPGAG